MDASTLAFHTTLLRLLRGCLTAYERWLDEQQTLLAVESLKERKVDLSRELAKEKTS